MSRTEELTKQIMDLKTELRNELLKTTPEKFGDYQFEVEGGTVMLSELFGDSKDLLIWHNMGKSCNYCTLWADGLTGYVHQLERRCPVVVVSPDQLQVQKEFAKSRGWNFKMVRDADKSFSTDTGFYRDYEGKKSFWPGMTAFHKEADGSITKVNSTFFGPGDDFCLFWPSLELLQGGINDFEPEQG